MIECLDTFAFRKDYMSRSMNLGHSAASPLIGNVKEFAKLQEGALHALANTNPAALLFDDGLRHLVSCIVPS